MFIILVVYELIANNVRTLYDVPINGKFEFGYFSKESKRLNFLWHYQIISISLVLSENWLQLREINRLLEFNPVTLATQSCKSHRYVQYKNGDQDHVLV